MKDVIISIRGTQHTDDSDSEEIELVTDGQYSFNDGEPSFTYMESELTGMEGTRTSFSVSPARVVMSREGRLNTSMVFQQGKKHFFMYETPYGAATMGVNTNRIVNSLGENGGDVEIDYVLDVDHMVVGRNKFKINVREAGGGGVRWQI